MKEAGCFVFFMFQRDFSRDKEMGLSYELGDSDSCRTLRGGLGHRT